MNHHKEDTSRIQIGTEEKNEMDSSVESKQDHTSGVLPSNEMLTRLVSEIRKTRQTPPLPLLKKSGLSL